MNMANSDYQEQDFNYSLEIGRRTSKEKFSSKRRMSYSRSNRPAVMHNGIHRRRNKRFTW